MRCNSHEYILGLRTPQLEVFKSAARFRILVAGRRFGKTQLALTEMLVTAISKPNARVWYVAPTYQQAKDMAWARLKAMTTPYWATPPSETTLTVYLISNSTISLKGADRPDSLRGRGLDLIVLDEYASMRPDVWTKVLRPALSDRRGRALFIGTPKGRNHFYDLFMSAKGKAAWAVYQFATHQGGMIGDN